MDTAIKLFGVFVLLLAIIGLISAFNSRIREFKRELREEAEADMVARAGGLKQVTWDMWKSKHCKSLRGY